MILDVYVISLVLIVTSTVNLQGHRGNHVYFRSGNSGVSSVREPDQTYQVGLKFRIFFLLEWLLLKDTQLFNP